MATKTVSFTANTTWQQVYSAGGAASLILNPSSGYSDIWIGTGTVPDANTFLLKPVAGENYLELALTSGDNVYMKSRRASGAILSYILKT